MNKNHIMKELLLPAAVLNAGLAQLNTYSCLKSIYYIIMYHILNITWKCV